MPSITTRRKRTAQVKSSSPDLSQPCLCTENLILRRQIKEKRQIKGCSKDENQVVQEWWRHKGRRRVRVRGWRYIVCVLGVLRGFVEENMFQIITSCP